MFVLGNFLLGLARVLDLVLNLYFWIVLVRALLSWVNPDPYNPIVRFLHRATDPVLYWVRRRIPVVFGGMDFSPMVVILGIYFARIFLVQTLADLALRLR
ncbi:MULTISPECIES: YggT family protein [Deferrisoma]|nr:MAG: YggT family protein [Candidatus Dadabacteria bacterium]